MLPFFFGITFLGKWFDDFFKSSSSNSSTILNIFDNNKVYMNHKFNDDFFNDLIKFEAKKSTPDFYAYPDKAANNKPTIGYGTCDLYDINGNPKGSVKLGDNLNSLRIRFGRLNVDNNTFAKELVEGHVKRKDVTNVYRVYKDLDSINNQIPYDYNLANALMDFYYNSGSAYGTPSYWIFLSELKKAYSNSNFNEKKRLASIAYLSYRLDYLVSWKRYVLNSWGFRTVFLADKIRGVNQTWAKLWAVCTPYPSRLVSYIANAYGKRYDIR